MIRFLRLIIILLLIPLLVLGQGYPPDESAGKMSVMPGFNVELVASEPQVRQPVAIDFDDKGRLWVLQYLQYPNPAGLTRVKVDRYSRTTYDRVPKPPPYGPKGADRLTILEDKDGDGVCESEKDFISGLNLSTGFAFGYGGVFVLQVPYLLYYPDQDGDDVPDSEPRVLLKGFGMEDTSSLANSLIFGPDGWLYGTQGTNISADIRGIQFEQGVWRYHFPTDRFELFCEGGGNSWGLDFDQEGNLLYSTNHGGYLMHHGVQGAYYEKAFAKHGELHNPFAFGYFPHVPHKNFQGGHVTVGGFFYRGNSFPSSFQGKYISVDTLGHAVHYHSIMKVGSTYRTAYAGTFLEANDNWFAPSDSVLAPDGSVYFSDWHDKRTAHPDPDADWDKTNGRIYRLSHSDAPAYNHVDPNTLSSTELIPWLNDPNEWKVRRARRVLSERKDPSVIKKLESLIHQPDRKLSREAFWTLAGMQYYEESVPIDLLEHPDEVIRSWAIRLYGDLVFHHPEKEISTEWSRELLKIAEKETSPLVISQMACTAKRLPGKEACKLIFELGSRDEFVNDDYIPLLTWWALEEHSVSEKEMILQNYSDPDFRENPIVSEYLTGRLIRRYAAEGTHDGLAAVDQLIRSSKNEDEQFMMLQELDAGLKLVGRKRLPGLPMGSVFTSIAVKNIEKSGSASQITEVPDKLLVHLNDLWKKNPDDPLLLRILMRLGQPQANQYLIKQVKAPSTDKEMTKSILVILQELGNEECLLPVLELFRKSESTEIQELCLNVLGRFSSPEISHQLIMLYPDLSGELKTKVVQVLLSRKESALEFLKEIDRGKYPPESISSDQLQVLALHEDDQVNAIVRKHWGAVSAGTPEEKLAEIRRLSNDLRAFEGHPEPGKVLFEKHCGTCHQMFGKGTEIGPDLTRANRTDQLFLLTSIVDPNAQIRKEFLKYQVSTLDGRIVIGLLKEETESTVTLLTEKNEKIVIERENIDELSAATTSLMPENLLKKLKPQELRDLFEYLKTAQN